MILRRTLNVAGWCAIGLAPLYGVLGLWSTFNMASTAGQPVEPSMIWSTMAGVVPAVLFLIGFGAAMLMLASIDQRLGRLEGKS